MSISQSILPEFDQEMATTRKVLERVPNDKLGWKAHPKSNTIGWVASHLAEIPGWAEGSLTRDTWDINPVGGEPYKTQQVTSSAQALEIFDANVDTARKAIAATSDADFMKSWSLLSAGNALMTMPRIAVIRVWVLNHTIHHRAYLCAYLRQNDVPVPAVYGPSGDE